MGTAKVAVIIPVKNGQPFLSECLNSLLAQTFKHFQVCIFDDGSSDATPDIISKFSAQFLNFGISFRQKRSETSYGVGYAKNQAIELSDAPFLCFCDADDLSLPNRIQIQYDFCLSMSEPENCLIGSHFLRDPIDSTKRYTSWALNLNESQLYKQIYTAFGPTLIAPTWFLSRRLYDKVGGFNINYAKGFPEDLDFFYRLLQFGATLKKIDQNLVVYRYHINNATFGVDENTIWDLRIKELQKNVLCKWKHFTIWNAGKQGKKFYSQINKDKVRAFIDVDEKKLRHGVYNVFDRDQRRIIKSIPIIPYSKAIPPVINCVKLDMTNGVFEQQLNETGWKEGIDYYHFS